MKIKDMGGVCVPLRLVLSGLESPFIIEQTPQELFLIKIEDNLERFKIETEYPFSDILDIPCQVDLSKLTDVIDICIARKHPFSYCPILNIFTLHIHDNKEVSMFRSRNTSHMLKFLERQGEDK